MARGHGVRRAGGPPCTSRQAQRPAAHRQRSIRGRRGRAAWLRLAGAAACVKLFHAGSGLPWAGAARRAATRRSLRLRRIATGTGLWCVCGIESGSSPTRSKSIPTVQPLYTRLILRTFGYSQHSRYAHAGSRGRGAARPGPRVREVRAARRIRSEVATPNVQRTVHETHIANVWLFTTTTDNTHETLGPGPAAAVRARGAANPKLQLRMFSITCACASPHLAQ